MLDRVTEVFCEVDDFCQALEAQWQATLPYKRIPYPLTASVVVNSAGHAMLGMGDPHLNRTSYAAPVLIARSTHS